MKFTRDLQTTSNYKVLGRRGNFGLTDQDVGLTYSLLADGLIPVSSKPTILKEPGSGHILDELNRPIVKSADIF